MNIAWWSEVFTDCHARQANSFTSDLPNSPFIDDFRIIKRYTNAKNPVLKNWFDECGIQNIKMELIREYQCADLKHLHALETLWINKFGLKNLINQRLSFQCISDKARFQQYYKKNRKAQIQKAIKYYYDHHEAIRKKYKDDPSAQIERVKNWIAKNKERHVLLVKRWQKGSFTCECGKLLKNGSRYSHGKSKRHQQYVDTNISVS